MTIAKVSVLFRALLEDFCKHGNKECELTLELMVVAIGRLVDLVVDLVQVDLELLAQHDLLPVAVVVLDQHPKHKIK